MLEWYGLLARFSAWLATPFQEAAAGVKAPYTLALLLGLVGSTSPCQLSTNLGALAFIARRTDRPGAAVRSAAYYALGKVIFYGLLGGALVVLGGRAGGLAPELAGFSRKLLGPALLMLGLHGLFGLRLPWPRRLAIPALADLAARVRAAADPNRPLDAGAMGFFFSFAFCPTLAWLYFGLALPLALQAPAGWLLPGVFAAGIVLPVLGLSLGLARGLERVRRRAKDIARVERRVRVVAAVVFLLAGVNDVIAYWWI